MTLELTYLYHCSPTTLQYIILQKNCTQNTTDEADHAEIAIIIVDIGFGTRVNPEIDTYETLSLFLFLSFLFYSHTHTSFLYVYLTAVIHCLHMQVQGPLTNKLAVSMVTKQQTEVHCGQKAPCPGISSPTGFTGDIVTGNATHRLVSPTLRIIKVTYFVVAFASILSSLVFTCDIG